MVTKETVGVVGLGLIGASFAKAVSASGVCVLGADIQKEVVAKAIQDRAICGEIRSLSECSVVVLALYPEIAVNYIKEHQSQLPPPGIHCMRFVRRQETRA